MLQHYPLLCQCCGGPAALKIASEWSDGQTRELKTYSICCEACLPKELASAKVRQGQCRVSPGESLGAPGVYDEQHPRNRGRVWVLRGAALQVGADLVVPLAGAEG
jgi:hypothetical protein